MAWGARGVSPSPSPTAPELDSGCRAEGGQKWGFRAGFRGELADWLYLGPKSRV